MTNNQNKITIPIMTCFDDNYAMPSAPCFFSMMSNADPQYYYKIYVLHSNIKPQKQQMLKKIIAEFPNGDIEFINMEGKYQDIFDKVSIKMYFTKEVLYKFLPQDIFPQYDKMIVTDVDVLFLGNIAPSYFALDENSDYYMAGVRVPNIKTLTQQIEEFNELYGFDKADLYCGGYFIYNLKKLRQDRMEEKFVQFMLDNAGKTKYMEQDALNAVCCYRIQALPFENLICNYHYVFFDEDPSLYTKDTVYTEQELRYGMENPIQFHYPWIPKPWNDLTSFKAEIWWTWFRKTPYIKKYKFKIILKTIKSIGQLKELGLKGKLYRLYRLTKFILNIK